jgi:hypothetical protein
MLGVSAGARPPAASAASTKGARVVADGCDGGGGSGEGGSGEGGSGDSRLCNGSSDGGGAPSGGGAPCLSAWLGLGIGIG